MEQSTQSPERHSSGRAGPGEAARPKIVVHFSLAAGAVCSWRVMADSMLRVEGERVWVTRIRSPYDYWLEPGHTLLLQKGERIWASVDGQRLARLSLTSEAPARAGLLGRWLALRPELALAAITPYVRSRR